MLTTCNSFEVCLLNEVPKSDRYLLSYVFTMYFVKKNTADMSQMCARQLSPQLTM